ncbi:MAG: exodeoxyribonuclease VII small subunit [Firmicutes bacterium]|nr:exodeoxyribonuclease VII small subunit [Bacillota bacterium]
MSENMSKEPLTLEEALARLSEITEKMEKETLPLEEMMGLYREGKALESLSRKLLDKADQEIRILEAADQAEDAAEDSDTEDM